MRVDTVDPAGPPPMTTISGSPFWRLTSFTMLEFYEALTRATTRPPTGAVRDVEPAVAIPVQERDVGRIVRRPGSAGGRFATGEKIAQEAEGVREPGHAAAEFAPPVGALDGKRSRLIGVAGEALVPADVEGLPLQARMIADRPLEALVGREQLRDDIAAVVEAIEELD